MTPEFNAHVLRAHGLGLKVGPMSERPNGLWRVYVQKDKEIMECAEGETIEAALDEVLTRVEGEPAEKERYGATKRTGFILPSGHTTDYYVPKVEVVSASSFLD